MHSNPFASYDIDISKKYQESIKRFCQTGTRASYNIAPFERQVDFWYYSFLLAVREGLSPVYESDTYHPIQASILSSDPHRITHIQLAFFAVTRDIHALADHRKVFNFAIGMANAGIPRLIQILSDSSDEPLWNLLEFNEGLCK